MISVSPTSNITDVLKEEKRHSERHRGKVEAEPGGMQPQAKEQQGFPGATRSWKGQGGFYQSRRERGMPTPWFRFLAFSLWEYVLVSSNHLVEVICYSSPRKRIEQPRVKPRP